eukprot:SAG22_NODE_328_length_12271_cov_9.681811_4_plen_256_part_00
MRSCRGWAGNVDIDECASSPCRNGATCVESSNRERAVVPGAFVCECAAGFSGHICEDDNDECESDPCQNGGTCSESSSDGAVPADAFACDCAAGYNGAAYEGDVNDCIGNPCTEHGSCIVVGTNAYNCRCDDGYSFDDGVECVKRPCAAGMDDASSGTTRACTNCTAGRYSSVENNEGEDVCNACNAGQYSTVVGSADGDDCIECIVGTFASGPGSSASSDCISCASGSYQANTGSIACDSCDTGQYSDAGATEA